MTRYYLKRDLVWENDRVSVYFCLGGHFITWHLVHIIYGLFYSTRICSDLKGSIRALLCLQLFPYPLKLLSRNNRGAATYRDSSKDTPQGTTQYLSSGIKQTLPVQRGKPSYLLVQMMLVCIRGNQEQKCRLCTPIRLSPIYTLYTLIP